MNQTKIESLLESAMNILSGFVISWAMYKFVIVISIERGYLRLEDAFTITMIFTITSLIRSYVWRRFFNKGLHKVVHQTVKKVFT